MHIQNRSGENGKPHRDQEEVALGEKVICKNESLRQMDKLEFAKRYLNLHFVPFFSIYLYFAS
jgi:hypothetical protein